MKLRIAVWHHLPPGGGAKRALHQHLQWLHGRGHHLEIWSPPSGQGDFLPLSQFGREHVIPLGEQSIPSRLAWAYKQVGAEPYLLMKLHALTEHSRRAAQEIDDGKFDIMLATTCQWLAVPSIAAFARTRGVLYLNEPYRPLYEATTRLPWVEEQSSGGSTLGRIRHFVGSSLRAHPHRVYAREERRHVLAFARVLANSRFSRESLLRAYGVDSTVCYLGIDATIFENSVAPRQPLVVGVGQFHASKNPEFVIRAAGASRSRPRLRWICNAIHSSAFVHQMKELAASLGVPFELLEGVADEVLVRSYQEAAVFAYAPRLEPFGLAPLEANACGTPVVAVAEGGVRETVEHGVNGLLVDTIAEMAQAIDRLIADPEQARALGQRGAALVRQKWTAEAAGKRLEQRLLESLAT